MKLVTRAQWGARPWREPSGSIRYAGPRRGVKVHYLGTPYTSRRHSGCSAYVRSLQASHMDRNGWSDLGYSFVVCEHGSVFEGRGLKRRNSANGNTSLNEAHYAVCALHGTNGQPGAALLDGLRDAIDYCRVNGPCGSEIKGHRDGYATACPGEPLYAWVRKGAPRPKEEHVPLTKDEIDQIALRVWNRDHFIPRPPDGVEGNDYWAPKSYLRGTFVVVRRLEERLKAQDAVMAKLVDMVAAGPVDAGDIKRQIREAIESIDVQLTAE